MPNAIFEVAAAMHGYDTTLTTEASAAREDHRVWDLAEHLQDAVAA